MPRHPDCYRKKNLTDKEREEIMQIFLQNIKPTDPSIQPPQPELRKGVQLICAAKFKVSARTVGYIWADVKKQLIQGKHIDIRSKMRGKKSRRRLDLDAETLLNFPVSQRKTERAAANCLGCSKSKVHNLLKEGVFRRHSNTVKPRLTPGNKMHRLEFCLSFLEPSSIPREPSFKPMYWILHMDEKWFYLTQPTARYILLQNEKNPHREIQHKNHIPKVMFMACVGRPVKDNTGKEIFDGKIGIFPFFTREPAKRNSKNRPAGTMETKAMTSVTRKELKDCTLYGVIPKIKQKVPNMGQIIWIQQDNCATHIKEDDPDFLREARAGGWDIRISNQPPNSPDTNVLDLGFFRKIQSLQQTKVAKDIEHLMSIVEETFEDMPSSDLNKIYLTLMQTMESIMVVKGGWNYEQPHMGKDKLDRMGQLPEVYKPNKQIVERAQIRLSEGLVDLNATPPQDTSDSDSDYATALQLSSDSDDAAAAHQLAHNNNAQVADEHEWEEGRWEEGSDGIIDFTV